MSVDIMCPNELIVVLCIFPQVHLLLALGALLTIIISLRHCRLSPCDFLGNFNLPDVNWRTLSAVTLAWSNLVTSLLTTRVTFLPCVDKILPINYSSQERSCAYHSDHYLITFTIVDVITICNKQPCKEMLDYSKSDMCRA